MFKSFFNTNKDNEASNMPDIGLSQANPILLSSVSSSFAYLNALCTISEGLSYKRIGSIKAEDFTQLVDKYTFIQNNSKFCDVFIYPYHNEDIFIIPAPFKNLNPDLDNNIFN
jgi:hypothetical protein